jgi:hypothetical protein
MVKSAHETAGTHRDGLCTVFVTSATDHLQYVDHGGLFEATSQFYTKVLHGSTW